jgi:hypothetical protein
MTSEADLRSTTVVGAMMRHKLVVAICALVGLVGGIAYASLQPRRATASALLVVRDPHSVGVGADGSVAARYTADQANLLRSQAIAAAASKLLAHREPPIKLTATQVMNGLGVSTSTSDNTLNVSFRAPSKAAALAGNIAVVNAYGTSVSDDVHTEIGAEIAAIDSDLARLKVGGGTTGAAQAQTQLAESQLLAQRAQLVVLNANPFPGVAASAQPHVTVPSKHSAALRAGAFGFIFGLLVAALICYLLETRRRRVRDGLDASEVLGVAVLTSFDTEPNANASTVPRAIAAVALNDIVVKTGARLIAVIGADERGNASGAAYALAAGYKATRGHALVVDLSRRDSFPTANGAASVAGFAELASGVAGLSEVTQDVTLSAGSHVPVITRGESTDEPLSWSPVLEDRLADGASHDVAFFVFPDLDHSTEDLGILTHLDGAVIVVPRGAVVQDVRRLARDLEGLRVPVLAALVVARNDPRWLPTRKTTSAAPTGAAVVD